MDIDLDSTDPFLVAFWGSLISALRWPQLDQLWGRVRERADAGWYLYAVGESPPLQVADAAQVRLFLREIDALLRAEHHQPMCGIVYADDLRQPTLIKIYDPQRLGTSCGLVKEQPLPGWVMSLQPPSALRVTRPLSNDRRRWWRRVLDGAVRSD